MEQNNKNTELSQEIYKEMISIIKKTRVNKRITIRDVAKGLSVTYQQYQKYETLQNRIPIPTLINICKILNLDISVLIAMAESKVRLDKGEE